MKRTIKAIKNYPGIYRVYRVNGNGEKFEPKRGKFRVYFDLGNNSEGRRRKPSRSFNSLPEAKAFRSKVVTERDAILRAIEPKGEMQFRDLVKRWTEDALPHVQPTTRTRYKSYLRLFEWFSDMIVADIGPATIDQWISYLKHPSKLAEMHPTRCGFEHECTVLRQILNYYASRFDRNYRSPFLRDHAKMLKIRETAAVKKDLTIEEFGKFQRALSELLLGTRHEVIYYLLLMQYAIYGRVQEAAALHFGDFDFERRKIYVRRKVQWARSKGEFDRVVSGSKANGGKEIPMSDFGAQLFNEWRLKSGRREGLLFTLDGVIVTYRQIAFRCDEALRRAGLPFSGTHIIRHASLSEHYDTCRDLKATAKVAGHSDLRATDRYAKVRDERMVETQRLMDQKLSGIFGKK